MTVRDPHKTTTTQQSVFHHAVDSLPQYTLNSESQEPRLLPYLPIEYFRDHGFIQQLFRGLDLEKGFLSSGTTASTRSHSVFSKEGLAKYKANSLAAFTTTLHQWITPTTPRVQGFSLVPTTSEWPESSLAQMVAWIAAEMPVTYCIPDQLAEVVNRHLLENPTTPCWLFGTAFHYVQRADAGFPGLSLPRGSVVFETGGTKGKSRSVSQDELEALLMECFQVPRSHIISEYGMCELQCQAYSVKTTETLDPEARWMRFSPSVKTSVMTVPGICASSGRGLLMVSDPDRVDFPWPIRTEDLVDLRPDGAIRLLGRAPKTPLKGCSLNVKEIELPLKPTATPDPKPLPALKIKRPLRTQSTLDQRIRGLQKFLSGCSKNLLLQALTREFGSKPAAVFCWNDLFDKFPKQFPDSDLDSSRGPWLQIMDQACGGTKDSTDHWLFLLPENHSVVGVYPLLVGYLCGLKITVRLPRSFADTHSFLNLFLADCARLLPGFDMEICPPSLRLDPRFPASYDRILVYGTDHTVDSLQRSYPRSVQGFGHRWAMSVVTASDLTSDLLTNKIFDKIFRDFFSLNQSGCRSSRLLWVLDDGPSFSGKEVSSSSGQGVIEVLSHSIKNAPPGSLLDRPRSYNAYSMEFEACRLRRLGYRVSGEGLLLAYRELAISDEDLPLEPLGAMTPGTLPILITRAKGLEALHRIAHILNAQTHLGQIGFSAAAQDLLQPIFRELNSTSGNGPAFKNLFETLPLGEGNKQIWNGLHQNQPLWGKFSEAKP